MTPEALAIAEPALLIDETWPEVLAPRLAEFTAYLDRCRPAPEEMPRLAAFDLIDVPDLIAHINLVDPVFDDGGGVRFRFRFVGTWHLLTFGRDVTGRFIDELYEDPLARDSGVALHRVVETGEPHYWRRPSVFRNQQFLFYQRIMAPLADDAGRISRLVGCYDVVDA